MGSHLNRYWYLTLEYHSKMEHFIIITNRIEMNINIINQQKQKRHDSNTQV